MPDTVQWLAAGLPLCTLWRSIMGPTRERRDLGHPISVEKRKLGMHQLPPSHTS